MIDIIIGSSFSITSLGESSYRLNTHFHQENGSVHCRFIDFHRTPSLKEATVCDIFTKNGKCASDFQTSLFKQSDLKDCKGIPHLMMKYSATQYVAVVDLKDGEGTYHDLKTIQAHEKQLMEFLSQKTQWGKTAGKIRELLLGQGPFFMICEGSLKHDLLEKFFSKEEIRLLSLSSKWQAALPACRIFNECDEIWRAA